MPINKKMEFSTAIENSTDFFNLNYNTNTFVTEFKDPVDSSNNNGIRKSKKISKITS